MTLRISSPKRIWQGHKPQNSSKTTLKRIASKRRKGEK